MKSLGHVEMLVVSTIMYTVGSLSIPYPVQSTGAAMQEEMDEWVQTCYDQEMTR